MRPIRLEMNGFASFRAETVVDFEGADYFALVGPTGAGKSTVIDAMVFALFGSAPRWDRKGSVQYALAPTATSATVRLVFDVGNQRYQVAREVRRVGKAGPQQRSASLERFDDPSRSTATTDEVDVIASEVRDVTPAVEDLLGLSFDDFTKAVVLPQGRFAEFLSATVGERQEILLKLLGAHQYDVVMRAAGARRAAADTDVVAAEARIGDLGGATQEAAAEADARVVELDALGARIADLQGSLDTARAASATAAAALAAAGDDVRRLGAVRIPDGIADLAERSTAVRAEAERRRAEAVDAEAAYGEARAALEAGGNRARLERCRDQWVESADLASQLPTLTTEAERAAAATRAADLAREQAESVWSEAFAAQAAADRAVEAAEADLASLGGRRDAIARVAAPEGLTDLAQRLDDATATVASAESAAREAEAAEDTARATLREAGDPAALTAELARADTAIALRATLDDLTARAAEADTAVGDADAMARAAESELSTARAGAEEARRLVTAAGLRSALEVGHACPVCTTTVEALPEPIDAAEADAADVRVRQAEAALRSARDTLARAEADLSNQRRAVRDAKARLADLLPDGADPQAARTAAAERLALVTGADAAVRTAERARAEARRAAETARAAAASLDAERRDALAGLRVARATVLAFGAPIGESDSVQESWRELTTWAASALADLDAVDLPRAREARDEAAAGRAAAQQSLDAALSGRATARSEADSAHTAHLRADAALARSRERSEALRELLLDAPPAAEVADALAALAALEERERAALQAFQTAGRARNDAVAAERALREDLASADLLLRETRDPLAPLGAPAVDASDLPGAWSALAAWARDAKGAAEDALLRAHTAAESATTAVTEAERNLLDAATGAGLTATTPAQVAPAFAAESARAADRVARIRADLERLASLHEKRAEAEQRRHVAGMLADHLSAKKFQRWLAGAALDVLVEAASSSLLELSGGQFSLTHEKGEFFVIDHADAEARRSVRTLSGGETFQASLALALALSAELSSLSSSAAKLDSIFLDEGFGSLDPDSLEVVALTLERLAQGDRLVGVVTHVQGLAERVPTRFVVARTSRTSTVTREG